jgi:hypothetical protein
MTYSQVSEILSISLMIWKLEKMLKVYSLSQPQLMPMLRLELIFELEHIESILL